MNSKGFFVFYFALHVIIVVSWIVFFLQFVKSYQYERITDGYIFGFLSVLFFILTFLAGMKLISLDMSILKTGGWLHLKITLALIIGVENIYYVISFFKKKTISKKILEISYWISYVIFMFILFLTFYRPF